MRVTPGEKEKAGRGEGGHRSSLLDKTQQHLQTRMKRWFRASYLKKMSSLRLMGKQKKKRCKDIQYEYMMWPVFLILTSIKYSFLRKERCLVHVKNKCCYALLGLTRISYSDIIPAFVLPSVPSLDTAKTCLASISYHFSGLLGFISIKPHFVSTTGQ